MEAVLDRYAQPEDANAPRVCFDGCPDQVLDEVREPWPPQPGTPAREDDE